MRKKLFIAGAAVLATLLIAGCDLFKSATTDTIVGTWQQVSVNGVSPLLVNLLQFNDNNSYSISTTGVTTSSGTWTSSGDTYTLTGSIFGFVGTASVIVPTFSSSDNTMTYTDAAGYAEVYNRK